MYGHNPPGHRPTAAGGGSGRGGAVPPLHALPPTPNYFIQNVNPYFQNPTFQANLGLPYLQNPTLPTQNPTLPMQNTNLPLKNPNLPMQNTSFPLQNPSFAIQNTNFTGFRPQPPKRNKEALDRVDGAVAKARRDVIATGESVSAWKVSQSALLALQVDSWESLGFPMQEVPSLHSLIVIEGKINSFIHCFVGVRRITSLYDLEMAICKNEGVEQFEDLELGPLVRHPLIMHYFSISSDASGVFKITSAEIISCLDEFMEACKDKHIIIEEFLEYIAKKRSLTGRERLGVRIQSLGMHISFIREARKLEHMTLKKSQGSLKQIPDKKIREHPLRSSEKKKLDERFSAMSQRVKSFASAHDDFGGKHTIFVSSCSEEDGSDDHKYEESEEDIDGCSNSKFSSPNSKTRDRVSSCPYPSAIEEMTRLGLKGETEGNPSASGSSMHSENTGPFKRKRKSSNRSCTVSKYLKLPKRNKLELVPLSVDHDNEKKELNNLNEADFLLANDSMRMFITTWKEACQEHTIAEVLERMLQFHGTQTKQRKIMKSMLSSYPFVGLLNVAVTSIKSGMWDSIYDTFQAISQDELTNKLPDKHSEYESIDVEPSENDTVAITDCILEHRHSVTVEDVMRNLVTFFELDHDISHSGKSPLEKKFLLFRQLSNCEFWVAEKFSVKEFKSLGFGDFFTFLEKHASILPNELHKCLTSDTYEKSPLEVCMLQKQLVVLLSQASNSLWENETLTKQKISMLLKRQFPSVGFKILENGCMDDFLDIVREQKSCVVSTCVLFSSTLLGTYTIKDSSVHNESLENSGTSTDIGQKAGILGPVTTKDAIEILIRAPMLSDLNSWSHWDLIFAPSLGPLVWWLLNEVNTKELLCLVTKDGKVMRIDHSATMDSFLEASLQGSSFRTAVQLLSLFSLFGGKRHVPFSLLKCHARQAFEVILRNSVENMEVNESQDSLMHGKPLFQREMLDMDATSNLSSGSQRNMSRTSKAVPVASRFLLDCLGYLPSEFRSFAADILLSGLQPFTINGPSAILDECNQMDQRVMLHEVGLSLGVMQWIDDYHAFSSAAATNSFVSSGALCLQAASSELRRGAKFTQNALAKFPSCEGEMIISDGACGHNEEHSEICQTTGSEGVSVDRSGHGCILYAPELNEHKDATLVIESIRRDEFGLDPTLSSMESSMLKKQHARLGRALHCLSQELYSQDSHFLLELVQNADDNIYPENVEPTLTFILQDRGIIVLNNEQGFSAQNIRALCDVGNSTKKGSKAGYIGQKGIGFKSVFRVTDAPEIHSNGFHVKFDISEGQIGFVLPTVIPPCNVDLFRRLASSDTDQEDTDSWNTCIVLPFRMKLSKGTGMSNIISMFSDLHPSLLLFLHHLRCIKFKNMLNDSLIIMRKEIVGDGIIKVSHGREKMTWFVISQKLRADVIRPDVQTTEIAIAFTLQESDNGEYSPHFEQQPVFAFLPLRTYGLKFILQGDFVLPSSREEVDGDSPWNQWLLSEFPGLFVTAERSFCALPCFRENPGKAVAAYMSFVPLVGEVHGFFSSLPRMIISKLRMSNCLLLEGDNNEWVPPCKVLRSWNEQARSLLPDSLLCKHLGLGFLDKNIHLSDPLARALGIQEYGPKILLQIISSLCHTEDGLKSMGLAWLSSWLNALYTMPLHYSGQSSLNSNMESDLIYDLKKIPFIPLSDGNYGSLDEGTIWLHSDSLSTELDGEHGLGAFPNLYAKLRIVNPALLSAASVDIPCMDMTLAENVTRMLLRIGVQQLSAHEIVQVHILPAMSDEGITNREKNLMIEYLSFVMVHLQSSCTNCRVEREYIISEICNKAFILTNHGYKRPVEVPIHFSKEFGNTIDVNRFINATNMTWHVVDIAYLKHPITESLSCGLMKWRGFFQALGVTDFVQIVQVEKNVSDISHMILKNEMWDRDLISHGTIAKDWESPELVQLLSILSKTGDQESCKNLLDVLDTLWDDCFSDKVSGYCNFKSSGDRKPFKSSLMTSICDFQWIASSMDDELHYPKDLFYDSDEVHLVLGSSAPYALPKVRSGKLACDIGFKTKVTLDDILGILQEWRRSETPFKASIAQMSKFYTFIWNETGTSSQKIAKEFLSGPFIFVPCASGSRHEDVVSGMLLSVEDVYWHDSTGSVDRMKEILPQCDSVGVVDHPLSKMLCNVYPGHHDFFVNGCGVHESPSLHSYIEILVQLSAVALPSQAANAVFRVFLKWTEGLKSKTLSSEDIVYLKECLLKLEFTVLPTVQDKWVSLHPSFGLVCWCDDEKLRKEFKHSDNLDFLYFGNLSDDEKERLQAKVSVLMQTLGIPSLSEVITQEAIYYGPTDSSFKASLVNWALPYAQRYIYKRHHKKYRQFKQSGFGTLNRLRVVVVEKLFYRNIIKRCESASKKRFEASCLLQDNILYTTQESDSHSVFMELSRLLFDGTPELHLANFLHMITTMAESGSNEEQTEFFILNSQKVPKLPDEESVWSLSSLISQAENEAPSSNASTMIDEQSTSKTKEKSRVHSNWPPVDWKTAPGFSFARANGFRTRAAASQPSSSWQKRDNNDFEGTSTQVDRMVSMEINANWSTEDDSAPSTAALLLPESETMEYQFDQTSNYMASEHVNLAPVTDSPGSSLSKFSRRDQLITGIPNAQQAMLTGRLGELVAFNYLSGKVGDTAVKWVNQESETGLPYDIVIGEKETSREFIEVKATKSARKDWFIISTREWQFAVEKGDSFSIAHVVLSGNNAARITMFKNPVKLCQLGQLQLAVMIPRQQKEVSVA